MPRKPTNDTSGFARDDKNMWPTRYSLFGTSRAKSEIKESASYSAVPSGDSLSSTAPDGYRNYLAAPSRFTCGRNHHQWLILLATQLFLLSLVASVSFLLARGNVVINDSICTTRLHTWCKSFSAPYVTLVIPLHDAETRVVSAVMLAWISVGVLKLLMRRLTLTAPALEAVSYHQELFDGRFHAPSAYRGTPSPGLEAAWERITTEMGRGFRVRKDDLYRLRKEPSETIWGFTNDTSGDAQAMLEIFHQLHCLVSPIQITSLYLVTKC
jgi:hypothetical protein